MLKAFLLAAALTLAGAAWAQDARPGSRVDADGDRRVSLVEMQAAQAQRFARLDANRDGRLTREERRAGRDAVRTERARRRADREAAMLARRDVDRDGVLSPAEAPARLAERFDQFDADRNGRLTAGELQAGRAALRASGKVRPAGGERSRADADGDGAITRAEAEAEVRTRFARMDANRDGVLTQDERRAHRQRRRGQA